MPSPLATFPRDNPPQSSIISASKNRRTFSISTTTLTTLHLHTSSSRDRTTTTTTTPRQQPQSQVQILGFADPGRINLATTTPLFGPYRPAQGRAIWRRGSPSRDDAPRTTDNGQDHCWAETQEDFHFTLCSPRDSFIIFFSLRWAPKKHHFIIACL